MKIVAGLLESDAGRAAMAHGAQLAAERDGTLILVAYVANPLNAGAASAYVSDRERLTQWLADEVQAIRDQGIDCEGQAVAGASSPSEAILDVAATQDADLIVIGLRRRSRVGKLVMGSNAQDILLRANCAVLGVKA